ncbi:hypothetical protein KEM48_007980 [Puccinia striiformis f. sp. tritici PST-130]|nr:hypothetical protein KEM48_007980 [Puccinia striiformis f. sp. tritici PST-130]
MSNNTFATKALFASISHNFFVGSSQAVADPQILLQLPRTALGSGGTAITRTTKVTMITSLVATAPKHAMLSLPRLKEIEKRELLQHLPPPLPSFFHRLKLYRTYLSASSWGI